MVSRPTVGGAVMVNAGAGRRAPGAVKASHAAPTDDRE
jgi:hypothetical protein